MSLFPVLGALLGAWPSHSLLGWAQAKSRHSCPQTSQQIKTHTYFATGKMQFVFFCAFMSATCKTIIKDTDCAYRAVKELESLGLKHGDKSWIFPQTTDGSCAAVLSVQFLCSTDPVTAMAHQKNQIFLASVSILTKITVLGSCYMNSETSMFLETTLN